MGPCFVGLGLEGELTDKWTKYKARNAVERQYVWKLHAGDAGPGVPYLAVSAMDWEGCYTDPDKKGENDNGKGASGELKDGNSSNTKSANKVVTKAPPSLHPDDDALINWKGSTGDTAAEQLQQRRDRARAAARLALAQGYGTPLPLNKALTPIVPSNNASSVQFKLKAKNHLQSRILDEKTPNFMKKTTYLTNDATSVHRFTSLAKTQEERARDIDRAIADTKTRYTESDVIEKGFGAANSCPIIGVTEETNNDETTTDAATKSKQKQRVHPTKKNVTPVWDLPLLPDVPTWGQVYTHVVLDNPPKSVHHQQLQQASDKKKNASSASSVVNAQQLEKAIVADVVRQQGKNRMLCTVWVPENKDKQAEDNKESNNNDTNTDQPAEKLEGDPYQAVQRYDLDVLPLRDASGPAVHFLLSVDPTKRYVGYHPVGSRIQLSTGRPVVLAGSGGGGGGNVGNKDSEIATDKTYIERRDMESEEKQDVEKRSAEVDIDLAKKYGMVDDDEDGNGGIKSSAGFGRSDSGDVGNNNEYDKKDEEAEDTF